MFLERFLRICANTGALVIAYCLMSNHFHFLVRPGPTGLPDLMHRVLCSYANWFNRRHAAVGHLFQGRYGSRPLESVEDMLIVLRYIHLNPVAAGMVDSPGCWPWSSHLLHLSPRPPENLAAGIAALRHAIEVEPDDAIDRYRELMELGAPPDSQVFRPPGWRPSGEMRIPSIRVADGGSLQALLLQVGFELGVAKEDLLGQSKRRDLALARRELVRRAVRAHGHPLTAVARLLGRTPQAVSRMLLTPDPAPLLLREAIDPRAAEEC